MPKKLRVKRPRKRKPQVLSSFYEQLSGPVDVPRQDPSVLIAILTKERDDALHALNNRENFALLVRRFDEVLLQVEQAVHRLTVVSGIEETQALLRDSGND